MSAEELVKEINIYFSAFDNIMLHHGLEKIKRLGMLMWPRDFFTKII
jgi:hypothetical protein